MTDDTMTGAGHTTGAGETPGAGPSTRPARSGLVLTALILVAAVANLNLAVANVALPDIGKDFDASQTALNLSDPDDVARDRSGAPARAIPSPPHRHRARPAGQAHDGLEPAPRSSSPAS
jgi:hypothetical protein